MYKMINLFNWVTTLVEAFTFYGGGKGGSSGSSSSSAQDFFGRGVRKPYADMLLELITGSGDGLFGGNVVNIPGIGRNKAQKVTVGQMGISDFIQSMPGYQFGLDQGTEALQRKFKATGVGPSGYENLALQNYGQQYAGNYYNNLISNLMGASGATGLGLGQSSQSSQQGESPLWGVAGTVAAALPWSTWFSDKNLKTNIKHIDTIKGIKIYSFNYIWSYVKSIGVMAQDLLKMPQYKNAVHMTNIGYMVDYSKLPI
jgi:hypothetical protein